MTRSRKALAAHAGWCPALLIGLSLMGPGAAGCGESGIELSVDLKTDWQPGRQFVGVITTVGTGFGDDFEPFGPAEQVVAIPGQTFLTGERIAEVEGLEPGEHVVRVELLTMEGDPLALRETLLDLSGDFALTVLITSSCLDRECPGDGDPAELTACWGGRCVDPRCSPETPELCGGPTCTNDSECAGRVECSTGLCVEGECLVQGDDDACGEAFVCDLVGGCVLDEGLDGGAPCPINETSCDDALDDDCDGLVDCADPDCETQTCDDGAVCTENDSCAGGECTGDALDCDDGNECTDDGCDPASGCESVPNTAPCDDGTWCNGTDSCREGLCQDHADPPCGEFCNESTMTCDMCATDADCGSVTQGAWSTCGGFGGTCDETGTQSRSVMTPRCDAGACGVTTTTESRSCTRDRDGVSCGSTTFGSWGSCGGFGDACDATGTQSRTVTTRTCGGGSCRSNTSNGSRSCTRSVANGKSCGSGRVCCSSSCVSITSDRHCGACRVDCTAIGLTCASTGNGGHSCRGCSTNASCRSELNSAATCYDVGSPPAFCQCQCPGNGVCSGGGCGSNFFCHDESGHNYCSPNR